MAPIILLAAALLAPGERLIPEAQGAHVDPAGHSIEVTSKCLCLDGKPIVP